MEHALALDSRGLVLSICDLHLKRRASMQLSWVQDFPGTSVVRGYCRDSLVLLGLRKNTFYQNLSMHKKHSRLVLYRGCAHLKS